MIVSTVSCTCTSNSSEIASATGWMGHRFESGARHVKSVNLIPCLVLSIRQELDTLVFKI